MAHSGSSIRLARLLSGDRGNAVIVAVDHGLYFGPLPGLQDLPSAIQAVKAADGILMAAGMVPHCQELLRHRGSPQLILRMNWASNYVSQWNYDHSHSVPILTVADAVSQGADIALASLTLHNPDQAEDAHNVETFSSFVIQAHALGIPLIGEVFPTGGDDAQPQEIHETILIGCRVIAELGADLIKTFFTGKRFSDIVNATPVPILALGSKKTPQELDALVLASAAIEAGARGVVFGRNVFQSPNPARFLDALLEVVKAGVPPDKAAAMLRGGS
jgi:DhnA family fructose-bisphosphate aldolase class Ia